MKGVYGWAGLGLIPLIDFGTYGLEDIQIYFVQTEQWVSATAYVSWHTSRTSGNSDGVTSTIAEGSK